MEGESKPGNNKHQPPQLFENRCLRSRTFSVRDKPSFLFKYVVFPECNWPLDQPFNMAINDSKDEAANSAQPPAYSEKFPQNGDAAPPDLSARLAQLNLISIDEVC